MKTFIFSFILIISPLFTIIWGQNGEHYSDEIFSELEITKDLKYGQNLTYNGENQELLLDVYQAKKDTLQNRPLILFIHGGSFVKGDKEGYDVTELAERFAKKGYVTSSINYRLGIKDKFTKPTQEEMSGAMFRGTQDAKAAVRYFRKSFEEGNPYGIDTAQIYMAGSSAGGFIALHLAYLDEGDAIPSYLNLQSASLAGGLEGNSGNPGYSSKVKAIINISGAIGDAEWMRNNKTPLLSFHGDEDKTVPFGTDQISILIFKIMKVDGSQTIHTKANEFGINNWFVPHYGAGHVPHSKIPEYMDSTEHYMTLFLNEQRENKGSNFCACNDKEKEKIHFNATMVGEVRNRD